MVERDKLAEEIDTRIVEPGTVVLWWLLQSGIVLKTPAGAKIAIDPYLSDAAIRFYGVARKHPAPLNPRDLHIHAVLASHSHADHLDPDSITTLLDTEDTIFAGPPMAVDRALTLGVSPDWTHRLSAGDELAVRDLRIKAIRARHMVNSEPTPDAIGFLIETTAGIRIYHSGDTEYDRAIVADTPNLSASLLAINGTGGNMDASEAALLASKQHPGVAIPIHYGLWHDAHYGPEATIDPQHFIAAYRHLDPSGVGRELSSGVAVVIDSHGLAD